MIIVVVSFFAVCTVVLLFFRKFKNIFTLVFLFGKKGSGKSTLLVKYMYRYAKKGYTIYTNMIDCNFPTARIIRIEDLGDFVPEPYSFVALDEVGIPYDARKFKSFKDSTRDFYKLQRHYRVVVYMNSQSWDVDKKVRDLVDSFYCVVNFGPLSIGKSIRRKIVLTEATSEGESRIADNLKYGFPTTWTFTWLPRWRKYFDSFVAPEKPKINYRVVPGNLPFKLGHLRMHRSVGTQDVHSSPPPRAARRVAEQGVPLQRSDDDLPAGCLSGSVRPKADGSVRQRVDRQT